MTQPGIEPRCPRPLANTLNHYANNSISQKYERLLIFRFDEFFLVGGVIFDSSIVTPSSKSRVISYCKSYVCFIVYLADDAAVIAASSAHIVSSKW